MTVDEAKAVLSYALALHEKYRGDVNPVVVDLGNSLLQLARLVEDKIAENERLRAIPADVDELTKWLDDFAGYHSLRWGEGNVYQHIRQAAAALRAYAARVAALEAPVLQDEVVERAMVAAKSCVADLAHRRFADDFFRAHEFVLESAIRAALTAFVRDRAS